VTGNRIANNVRRNCNYISVFVWVECSVTSVRIFGNQSNVVCYSCICRNGDVDIS